MVVVLLLLQMSDGISTDEEDESVDKSQVSVKLQMALLEYLLINGQKDPALLVRSSIFINRLSAYLIPQLFCVTVTTLAISAEVLKCSHDPDTIDRSSFQTTNT